MLPYRRRGERDITGRRGGAVGLRRPGWHRTSLHGANLAGAGAGLARAVRASLGAFAPRRRYAFFV